MIELYKPFSYLNNVYIALPGNNGRFFFIIPYGNSYKVDKYGLKVAHIESQDLPEDSDYTKDVEGSNEYISEVQQAFIMGIFVRNTFYFV